MTIVRSKCDNNIVKLQEIVGRHMRSLFSRFDFTFFMEKFKRLRILSFADADIDELPNSMGKLKLLRYFDISGTEVRALPDSFTRLYNLETFKAECCWYLDKLPERMENLVELSHLYIGNRKSLVPINIGRLTCLQTLPFFAVGVEKGRGIAELGSLGQLQGRLEIHKLELVRNQEEAMAAKLNDKKQIRDLVLEWTTGGELVEQTELVLESLQPHTNLKGLEIVGYSGGKLPSWLSTTDRNPRTLLANLTRLKLSNCANCVRLPSLGHLDNLTYLGIYALPKVKSIGTEFYSDGNFPALKTIKLSKMGSLEEWVWATKLDAFPSLEDLTIRDCGKLKGIPLMNGLPSLEKLELEDCRELRCIGDGLSTCTRLKLLSITRCDDLKFLPSLHRLSSLERFTCRSMTSGLEWLPCLTSLVDLDIRKCPNTLLDGNPEQSWSCITALKSLLISECNQLEALPKGLDNLTSLTGLEIWNCPKLKSLEALPSSLKSLWLSEEGSEREEMPPYFDSMHQYIIPTSLEFLYLEGSKKWKTLPPQIQHLTTLQVLRIRGFGIEALPEWLGNLSSIQHLWILECQDLIQLPSRDSLLRLSNLNSLYIDGCPNLTERCDKERSGPEWSKISHIPFIQINCQKLQDLKH